MLFGDRRDIPLLARLRDWIERSVHQVQKVEFAEGNEKTPRLAHAAGENT
jgi:hypothetical protein